MVADTKGWTDLQLENMTEFFFICARLQRCFLWSAFLYVTVTIAIFSNFRYVQMQ